jgi:predicted nucleic acid-binding Zn ribbon protein
MSHLMNCVNCGEQIENKRLDAKYCSNKCRKDASRKQNVTDNFTLSDPVVTDNFKFYLVTKARKLAHEKEDTKSEIRTAKYWYNVPLAAIPVIQKDWPKIPEYMNGRQYFLWWKNDFKTGNNGPVILNPFKKGV